MSPSGMINKLSYLSYLWLKNRVIYVYDVVLIQITWLKKCWKSVDFKNIFFYRKNKTEDILLNLLGNIPESGIKHHLQTSIDKLVRFWFMKITSDLE